MAVPVGIYFNLWLALVDLRDTTYRLLDMQQMSMKVSLFVKIFVMIWFRLSHKLISTYTARPVCWHEWIS